MVRLRGPSDPLPDSVCCILKQPGRLHVAAACCLISLRLKGPEWTREIDRRLSRYTDKGRWPKRLTTGWQ
jgi:hypothetical protein